MGRGFKGQIFGWNIGSIVTENKYTKRIEIEFADALPQMPRPIKIQNIPNYSVVEITDK